MQTEHGLQKEKEDTKVAGEHRFGAGLREGGEGIGGEYDQITVYTQNSYKMMTKCESKIINSNQY